MRILPEERKAIVDAVHACDRKARIFLFGSRINDRAKGGDIDLLIVSNVLSTNEIPDVERQVFDRMEEQKIDFVFTSPNLENRFARLIMKKGAAAEL